MQDKLNYLFGKATGNAHNIERSMAMERRLNSIGIFDIVEQLNKIEKIPI